jgi:hypothetical protein
MRLLATTLFLNLAVGLCAGADDKAGTKDMSPAQVFKEWANYFVGGVWATTNAQGKKEEARWEWILDKSFIRLTWKIGEDSREEIHGIDPVTGQWTLWGFDSQGRVYKGVGQSAKPGEWSYRTSGQGRGGPLSIKHKDVKLGPNEDRYEIKEFILDGKKQPTEVQVWKRAQ